jgi:NADPH2:quinone reductase
MTEFRAFRIHQEGGKVAPKLETIALDALTAGEVVVRVRYSTINYKDALAASGAGKILRKFPLVGGIDLSGEVESSSDPTFRKGQMVLVTGGGLSETYDGGYAEFARVKSENVIALPEGLDEFQAMALGTAGFTAALAIHRMEQNGLQPSSGEILVSGATGGVGSVAIDMLAQRGYSVVALTGKEQSIAYLEQIGASRVLLRNDVQLGAKPLEEGRWAGAIDNLGGDVLAWLTRTVNPWGSIASVGMAASFELKTTVLPFILRGVNLLGINSVMTPRDVRLAVWKRVASDLKPRHLDRIVTQTISLDQLPNAFDGYLKAAVTGRTVVKIG